MTSIARFVGSIPELYDRHMGPVIFEPYALDLAGRVPANKRRVLEVAAGTGRVTRHLLARLPGDGVLVASDLNQPMLDIARAHIDDARVEWRVADAQSLPFETGEYDLVACQFGLMFVPDKPLALREMKRVLGPGGMLLLSTWDDLERNPASKLLHELAYATMPDDPPVFMKVPFSMPDPVALRTLALEAGFSEVRVDTVAKTGEAISAADLAIGFVRGNPIWGQLVERGIDGAALQARVTDALAAAFGAEPLKTALSAHVLTAVA